MSRIKNIWKLNWISILVLNIMLFQKIAYANQDFEILDSSDRGVTIQFTPKIERIDTVQLKGENYLKIYFSKTSFAGDPGDPMIPVSVFHVGIPLESEATVSMLSVESSEMKGKLLPAPEIDLSGKHNFTIRSANYQSTEFFPQQVVVADAPGFVRDQRVIKIKLFALQAAGAFDRIKLHNKMVIRVYFTGNRNESMGAKSFSGDDEFYRGVVVNFEQSKHWLKKHIPSLKRTRSQFQNENWHKIFIGQEGIYKITGEFLSSQGVDIDAIQAQSIRIYNNGGRELPRNLKTPRADSLIENAIRVVDLNGNGKIENTDYILFYGKSVKNWEQPEGVNFYQHYINHYISENVYWLTWNNDSDGKRMENKVSPSIPGLDPATDFWGLYYNEDEINNYLNSGLHWFGRLLIGTNQQQTYSVYLPSPANQENNIQFRIQCLGISYGNHRFSIYLNNKLLTNFSFSGSYTLRSFDIQNTIALESDGTNALKIIYNGSTSESQAYIDWFEIQYKKQFVAENEYLIFNQTDNAVQKYRVTNFQNDPVDVYDITDWANVQFITNTEISSGTVTFVDTTLTSPRRKYIALTP